MSKNLAVLLVVCSLLAHAQSKHGKAKPAAPTPATPAPKKPFNVVEASIPEMRAAMEEGRVTSHDLVMQYLARIGMYEDQLHAVMTVNPHALAEADERDQERAQGHVRGPLHGIPIALKDNILTHDIVTTGGALVFDGFVPPYDATLVKNLHDAGAVIIAKTTLTELANWVAGPPMQMPSGYNAVREFSYNPYDPRRDPREPNDGRAVLDTGGSSSGVGTAANFWAANVGTETSGSILNPSGRNMLVGIKPTVGRISRYGVIPITADQDTAGPMAKNVTDAAIMLGAMESASADPNDPATTKCKPPANRDYTQFLKADGLKGMRIGIPRAYYYDQINPPSRDGDRPATPAPPPAAGATSGAPAAGGFNRGGGLNPEQKRVMTEAIEILKQQGATIVDPADIPSITTQDPDKNLLLWGACSGWNAQKGRDANCSVVLKYGMKRDFNKFLATLGPSAPVKSLTELREWNIMHIQGNAIRFGESNLDISDEMDVDADRARYMADRAHDIDLAGTHGIEEAMKTNNLDVLLFPNSNGASIAAVPGYPTVIVPFATVPNGGRQPFPSGFTANPTPFGVAFTGMACSEPKLLQAAYAFEQATKRRVAPPSAP